MEKIEDKDEVLINNKTWDKLHATATKSGYRDGISEGRDSNFQSSFDQGYSEGLKNGLALGIYKGLSNNHDKELEKISRGNCLICNDKSSKEKPIPELISLQRESTDKILKHLHEKYHKTSINLPEKLN